MGPDAAANRCLRMLLPLSQHTRATCSRGCHLAGGATSFVYALYRGSCVPEPSECSGDKQQHPAAQQAAHFSTSRDLTGTGSFSTETWVWRVPFSGKTIHLQQSPPQIDMPCCRYRSSD
jgi:hypothetical protein